MWVYEVSFGRTTPDDFIFVGGSSHVVADLPVSLQERR